jgi:hypothetical protein
MHPLLVNVRSKWWPLPSHAPLEVPKSKFCFPKVTTVKMLYRSSDSLSTSLIEWQRPWRVPLTQRIANCSEWQSIMETLD